MKIHCKSCGCHFDNDFEETLGGNCTLWTDRGFLHGMKRDHKLALWNMYFSVPVDAIAEETGVVTSVDFRGLPGMKYDGNQWEGMVPGYKDWPDQTKRDFQKEYFRWYSHDLPKVAMEVFLMVQKHKEEPPKKQTRKKKAKSDESKRTSTR